MEKRYIAAMVLSGVGDAMGFKDGHWEFCKYGVDIHNELRDLGGVAKLKIELPDWPISDDTVMHLATAEALVSVGNERDENLLYAAIARHYVACVEDMPGRSAGRTCMDSVRRLRPKVADGWQIPFNRGGGGCGAAMRAMCIGLRYPRVEDEVDLIPISIEAGRITHHHPTGYLGSMAAALFTAYAVRGKPLHGWGRGLLDTLPKALAYIRQSERYVKENEEAWDSFENAWEEYVKDRNIVDGETEPKFPCRYGVDERDEFYRSISYRGVGGESGYDAPMIAYDALLGCKGDWEKLCKRGMLHGGDSDSTGVIAGACYGAMYGFARVPERNYRKLEYLKRLEKLGSELYRLSCVGQESPGHASASVTSSHVTKKCTTV